MIRGVIFDLDGTLVDSCLDFDGMRREMCLHEDAPILEALAGLAAPDAARCFEVLTRHEMIGAHKATILPGVRETCQRLNSRGVRQAVATRNSRQVTQATLQKLDLDFDPVITRDDGPVKPDPWPVIHVCSVWGLRPAEVVMIGDYRFDIESGRAAGARTVLLTHPASAKSHPNLERADLVLNSLGDYPSLFAWLDTI